MQLIPQELEHSSRRALFENGAWWTYADLTQASAHTAKLLVMARGLAFCFCRIDVASVVNYLACLHAGHVVALFDTSLPMDAKRNLLERYHPDLILGRDEPGPEYARLTTGVWRRLIRTEYPLHPDLRLLLSTSGTTGSPKLVRLSESNVLSNADAIRAALHILPDDCAMASLPFHYSFGLSVLHSHLRAGAALALSSDGMVSAPFWDVCRKAGCTSFAGVPYSYQVLRRLNLASLAVPQLTTFTQAGGRLAPELVTEFHALAQRRGGRFYVMYGQTEATARMAVLPPQDLPAFPDSVGFAIPGGQFDICTAGGELTREPAESGEVVYRGPNVMMGYAQTRSDLSRGDECGGILRTGDAGFFGHRGLLYISGRLKRDVKVAGFRINLDEVEDLLRDRGPCAAVAARDRMVVFCEWEDTAQFTHALRELSTFLRLSQQAFEFRPVEKLPRTGSGKVDYTLLAAEV